MRHVISTGASTCCGASRSSRLCMTSRASTSARCCARARARPRRWSARTRAASAARAASSTSTGARTRRTSTSTCSTRRRRSRGLSPSAERGPRPDGYASSFRRPAAARHAISSKLAAERRLGSETRRSSRVALPTARPGTPHATSWLAERRLGRPEPWRWRVAVPTARPDTTPRPTSRLAERQFALVRNLTGYAVYAPGQ